MADAVAPVETLWVQPEVEKLVAAQQVDGSWKYGGRDEPSVPGQNYKLLETYRNLRILVAMFGLDRSHPCIKKAAGYIFNCQKPEGDIRGIIGNQYMPYYHAAILELLIRAGFENDQRLIAGLDWLLTMRQDDGGWIVPVQAIPPKERTTRFWVEEPVKPDRSLPHSHMATGMVLRALAAHPDYRHRPEVQDAGRCLKSRFFEADRYNDRKGANYWLKFQYPFWWTNLVSALDILSLQGFSTDDTDIVRGLEWFIDHQQSDGLWPTGYDKGRRSITNRMWVGLAVCRIFHRFGFQMN